MTHRVAAVDCGTNSLRLLLADVDPGRAELTDVARRMEIVRLGQGVDRTGRLAPEALARTIAVLRDYADIIARSGAQAVRMVATSATRDADNAADFVRLVKEVLGVAPEVLTGAEEAVLSFTGATAELAAGGDGGPFLVTDIGGGSTEFVLGAVLAGGATPQDPPDPGGTHPPRPPLGGTSPPDPGPARSVLADVIDELWERRAGLSPADTQARAAVVAAVDAVDAGQARVAYVDPVTDEVLVDEILQNWQPLTRPIRQPGTRAFEVIQFKPNRAHLEEDLKQQK